MHEMPLRRWQVRPTLFDDWVELAGLYTAQEIARLRLDGAFCVAIPVYPRPPENAGVADACASHQRGLTPPAQELTAQLREHIWLPLLPQLFPDILNDLVQVWRAPQAAASFFEKLLFDKRWADRPEVFNEVVALREHYLTTCPNSKAHGQVTLLPRRAAAKEPASSI
jgi:hypothetical protein